MSAYKLFDNYYNKNVYPFDNSICKILNESVESCKNNNRNSTVFSPLGPKGKVGIPYKYYKCKTPKKVTIIKGSKAKKIFLHKLNYTNVCKVFSICKLNNNLKYCGLDEFTNESFIGMAIEDIIKKHKLQSKSYVKQLNVYICNNVAYNHMELCDLGDLSKIPKINILSKTEILSHALLQISQILHFLQVRTNYTHGDLKAGNVFIKKESTVVRMGSKTINCPITFKLADYGKSCMNIGDYRLFMDHPIRHVAPQIRVNGNNKTFVLNKFQYIPRYYRSQILFSYLRHFGAPFIADIDMYILIASLLLNNNYSDTLLDFPLIFHKICWIPSQVNFIKTHIEHIKNNVPKERLDSVNTAMHFLTQKLPNGKHIIMKKNIAQKLYKGLFHLIKNKRLK